MSKEMALFTDNGPLVTSEQDDRSYRHLTLPNKLQVLLIHDPETEKASAAMDTRVGCMSDPTDTQGIAHFLEHMLFMGTEKYPDENEYSKFLSAHGGASNAYTDSEDTVYYFDVNQEHLPGALDRFAQFFIAPLFTESATNREMNAVDSENAKNQQTDVWRFMQLKKSLARPDHPFHNFGTGNLETLKDLPIEQGVNLRERLLEFHAKFYSSNQMRLVILGKESLEDLTQLAVKCFSDVPNKDIEAPSFDPNPYSSLGIRLEVVPVKDSRKLEITWPTPSVEGLFDSKPMNYLSHLIGHEGPGSILSLLKAKGWANSLSAGCFMEGSSFGVFGCQVDCTDEGIANSEGVVQVIYQYISMLRKEGPKEWVFNESRDIAAMNFRFKSKSKPINYTVSCVTGMHTYPPNKTLSASSLFDKFDPDAINMVLECLTPKNMILMVCSRTFAGKTDKEERWYKTAYNMNEISASLLGEWSEPSTESALRLPDPNDFIATDFTLTKPPESVPDPEAPPKLVFSDDVVDVWFKHFGRFDKPKANMMVAIHTPSAYDSPRNMVLTNLYAQMCVEELNEFSYAADIAGCRFDISATRKGLEMDVFGYSHRLPTLLQQVAETVAAPKLQEAMFERLKDKLVKTYANFSFNQPYQHAMFHESLTLESPRWNYPDRIAALEPLTVQNLRDFKETLLGRAKLVVLMHGNSSPEAAIAAVQNIVSTLKPKPQFESNKASHARAVELPAQTTCVTQRDAENPAETNSGLEVVFQIGEVKGALNRALQLNGHLNGTVSDINEDDDEGAYRSLAVINLLMHLIKEPFFDDLRTKQQLGYLVFSGSMRFGDGLVVAARFLLQSEVKGPSYLDGRIEAFLLTFREFLVGKTESNPEGLSDEAFKENVAAVVESLLEKHKNLNEETSFLWSKLEDDSFDFERKTQEAKAMGSITQLEVLAFFDAYLGLNSPWRRKLSVRIHGNKHAIGAVETEETTKADVTEAAATAEGATAADGEAAPVLSPVPQVPGEVIMIEEPSTFQRTRPLYCYRPANTSVAASI